MNRTPTIPATRTLPLLDRLATEIRDEERKLGGAQRELSRLRSGVATAQTALAEARELQELAVATGDTRETLHYLHIVELRQSDLTDAEARLADSPSNGDAARATTRIAGLRGQVQAEERKRAQAEAARVEAQRVAALPLRHTPFAALRGAMAA